MYRQTQLWNASAAANNEVKNSSWAACDDALPPRLNNRPGPSWPAAATTWPWPVWAAIAQAASAHAHRAACRCRWAAASPAALGPNAPYRPTCKQV
jgi:hypothetical protein